MANITTEAEFLTRQWKGGTGYYGAHGHREPIPWRLFRSHMGHLDIEKARYVAYLISWILHHKREPTIEQISRKHGAKILEEVRVKLLEETVRQDEMKGAKPKGRKKR